MQTSNQLKHELSYVPEQTTCSLMSQDFAEDLVLCTIHHYAIVLGVKTPLCISQQSVLCQITMLESQYLKKWSTSIMLKQIHYVIRDVFRISILYLGPILSYSPQNLIDIPTTYNFSLLSQIFPEIIAAKIFLSPNCCLHNN